MFLGMIVRVSVQFVFVVSFKVLCSRGLAYACMGWEVVKILLRI
jgi:hypothetical protein